MKVKYGLVSGGGIRMEPGETLDDLPESLDQWKLEIDDASAVVKQATERISIDGLRLDHLAGIIEKLQAKVDLYEARIRRYQVVVDKAQDDCWTRESCMAVEDVFWEELGLGKKEVKSDG